MNRTGPHRLADLKWFALTAVTVGFLAVIPLIWNRRFYFQDDSENGAFGVWYHIGQSLLAGKIPVLNPSVWSSGNYLAEGQWGTWNPLIMLIGVAAYLCSNAVVFMTVLKVLMLMLAGTGVYLLARSYKTAPPLAYVAGFAVTLNGFTMYFDAPSWVTGLLVWALVPYFWVALRRLTQHSANPLPAFLVGYLIVTVGYLQGTFAIGFVLLAVGIDSLIRRRWPEALRVVGVGVALVLVAITVFLPGVLTASVTNRAVSIMGNDGMMSVDLGGLLSSTIATGYPQVASWWWTGPTATAPVVYVAWFLPVLLFVDWRKAMANRSHVRDLTIVMGLALAYVLLPTILGPLRYPVRFMPYLALTLIVLTVVALSRAAIRHPGRKRLVAASLFIVAAVYLSWAQLPPHYLALFAAGAIAIGGLAAIWWLIRRADAVPSAAWTSVAAVVVAGSLVLTAAQHYDTHSSPLSMNNVPADTSIPQGVLAGIDGDVIVVGDPVDYQSDPAAWRETLMANTWYLSPAAVQNRYQLIGFSQYNATMCLQYLGGTCPGLLTTLFETRDATGMLLVDQLSIDNIQILKVSFENEQSATDSGTGTETENETVTWDTPPEGWSLVEDTGLTVVWSRDEPVGPAGGVVWTSGGTSVETLSQTDTSVTMKVLSVASEGGTVALSRLAWPGYSAERATLTAAPVDGFLLGLDIPQSSEGEIVTVTFQPPGWAIELTAWLTAMGGILIWTILVVIGHLRRRSNRTAA
ncbi:hypothetical protein [Cryobacterium sp. TMT4-31]|uniref:hypothetical protein n=1 Tax=Cryobacterium sp. TMT4-31 TaxID=1259259 RepID=UPI00106C78A8|nr:hypothetical protein [Cryobacterium sp. TMT4-31]TFC88751.1 hypothetical protein E3T19_09400 [Cryobacterium sp. TMT4-31]